MTIVPIGFIPLFIPAPAFLFAFVWFGLQVLEGSAEFASPGMAASVAWWAHIGGFAFGALVSSRAMPLLLQSHQQRLRCRRARRHRPWSGGTPTGGGCPM
jgi:membrane associated rhomboid family serine protease